MKAKIKVHLYTNPIKQLIIEYKPKKQKATTHFLSATGYNSDVELAKTLIELLAEYELMYYNTHSITYHIPEGSSGLFMKIKLKNLKPRYKNEQRTN